MANYQLLKADIDEKVYENAQQKITGANLNAVLNAMVTTLGAEYQFAGVATIDTNPENPDAKVFYFANGKGTYTNFGGLEVTEDEVVVLYWDSAWHKVATGIASQEKLSELEQEQIQGGIYDVTANNDGVTFSSLSELLSSENLSTLIPVDVRCGGMSIRFVQSSDNKYVQFRYMETTTTGIPNPFLDTVNWQSEQVDSVPVKMSKNLAESGGIERSIEESVGLSIDLSRGYYDPSGNIIIDNPGYGHTNVLEENFIRENWNITPNSLIVWNNNALTWKYWSKRQQIKKFDHIAYNFQTKKSNAVCIRTSYLYNREQYISELVGNSPMGTSASTITSAVAEHESDIILLNNKLGASFILTQGYYNTSGVIIDSVVYGHTDILNESVVRTNWSITPNSVAAWKGSTFKFQYWPNIEKIGEFDKISYNFQTTERSVYNLTPTILSDKVVTLETKIGNTHLNTSAETITEAINELNSYTKRGAIDFAGKKVAIIGDSISTNGNLTAQNPYGNVPEIIIQSEDIGVTLQAYPTYYDIGVTVGGHEIVSSDVGTELTFVPIAEDVGKMIGKPLTYNPASTIVWWEILQQQLGIVPIPVCWSGSSITSHEGNTDNLKTSYAWHDATIRKCGIRIPGTMTRTAPDIVLIYRGTNDFSHVPFTKITPNYYDAVPWRYPDTDVIADGYGYLQGLCLTVKKLRTAYPNAIIFLCTMNTFKRVDDSLFAIDNDLNTLPQYSKAIRETADFLGCGVIEFDKDGITYENCYSEGYITDSETHPTHPSNKGHKVMGNRAILDLIMKCNSLS